MKKPIIGVTVSQNPRVLPGKYLINSPYIDAITAVGGIPLLIPAVGSQYAEQFLDRIDGLLLAGGEDVDPDRYGTEPSCAVDYINEARDDMELSLLELAVQRKVPVFGICRGLQLINVFFGGTLYQHLPTELPNCLCHVQDRSIRAQATHHVELYPGSALESVYGTRTIRVNSFHHQAIKDVAGDGIHVSAIAPDGVVEAIESDDGLVVATQWHPEEMVPYNDGAKRLFARLVDLASAARKWDPQQTDLHLPESLYHSWPEAYAAVEFAKKLDFLTDMNTWAHNLCCGLRTYILMQGSVFAGRDFYVARPGGIVKGTTVLTDKVE